MIIYVMGIPKLSNAIPELTMNMDHQPYARYPMPAYDSDPLSDLQYSISLMLNMPKNRVMISVDSPNMTPLLMKVYGRARMPPPISVLIAFSVAVVFELVPSILLKKGNERLRLDGTRL